MANKLMLYGILMLFLLLNFVNAELISIDPCPDDTVITEDINKIYLTSSCFYVEFDKTYGEESPISFYDSYNNDYFDLKLHSLTEINSVLTNQQRLYSFEDIGLTASIENEKIVYTSSDGKIRLLYSIVGNQVKAGLEIIDWTNYYTTSTFELRTRIHKEDVANSHFINLPAFVDGVEQALITESEFSGNNEFVMQTLYTGSSFSFLEIDPIYQVDYSPSPAQYLESGIVATYNESEFLNVTDITTEMSDGDLDTNYRISHVGDNYTIREDDEERDGQVNLDGEDYGKNYSIPDPSTIGHISVCYFMRSRTDVGLNTNASVRLNNNITSINLVQTTKDIYTSQCVDITDIKDTYLTTGYNQFGVSANVNTWELGVDSDVTLQGSLTSLTAGGSWVSYSDDVMIWVVYSLLDEGDGIMGHWTETYNSTYNYFLSVTKVTPEPVNLSIYGMFDHYLPNENITTSKLLTGIGTFDIDVNDILDWEKNNQSLNVSLLRITTHDYTNISEIYLRKQASDNETPIINNCDVEDDYLTCGESTLIYCNITDDTNIDYAYFSINSTNYLADRNFDNFSLLFSPEGLKNVTYNWNYVFAQDIFGQNSNLNPNLDITYDCLPTCVENWTLDTPTCLINDSYLITYTDQNSCDNFTELPIDNGTYTYCNYCSEDLVVLSESECYLSGIVGNKNVTYIDNNYFSCCAITNITSDCSNNFYPYNDTIIQSCAFLSEDFDLLLDENIYFGIGKDKAVGVIDILNYTNESFKCVTYVKTIDNNIIQTNPDYERPQTSLIQIIPKSYDDREYFTVQNSLSNVYWTNDNLVVDGRQYIFSVACSSNGNILVSEKVVNVNYKSINAPITRWFWAKQNVIPLMLGFLIILILILIFGFYINRLRN